MNKMCQSFFVLLISIFLCANGFGMEGDQSKAGHPRPSTDRPISVKRQKLEDKAELNGRQYRGNNKDEEEEDDRQSRFLAKQSKARYFQNFRSKMERKFSYWGPSLGELLDKLSALYLDRPSDKPGVFVVGSMPGVGKNTLVKHIRDFLENDPYSEGVTRKARFQLIKDKGKRIFDPDILKNSGSSERSNKGIHKVVVIDEIQAMLKDYGHNSAGNELWFHAFGDAEINIDNASYISLKKKNICTAMKDHFGHKTQLNSTELEISKLKEKLDEASQNSSGQLVAMPNNLPILEKRKEEIQATINSVVNYLTVELRELMGEIPDFFAAEEKEKSAETLARAFLDSDVSAIERRFSALASYKHLYFDRNIYIFLGNPAKVNDDILEGIERSSTKTRDSLRKLAKEKLTESTVRAWFMSHALHVQYYGQNKRGWDSRIPNVFAICPPATKHISPLLCASIESDFCCDPRGNIKIDDGALAFFSAELKDPTKDLRSLSTCYSPVLTRMFTELELELTVDDEPKFILERQGDELVLMLEADRTVKVTHRIKTKQNTTQPVQPTTPTVAPEDEGVRERNAFYSACYYGLYQILFPKLPAELYRIGDEKFNAMYEEATRDFNLAKELSILSLNMMLKYVGMTKFTGEIDRVYSKDRAIASILNIVNYISGLKSTHGNQEIYSIIKVSLNKMESHFGQFFGNSGIFEYLDKMLIDTNWSMVVDGSSPQSGNAQNARPSNQEIADKVYEILISSDNSGANINSAIEQVAQLPQFQFLSKGLFEEFLKSKKLIVTFDCFGQLSNIIAAGNQ